MYIQDILLEIAKKLEGISLLSFIRVSKLHHKTLRHLSVTINLDSFINAKLTNGIISLHPIKNLQVTYNKWEFKKCNVAFVYKVNDNYMLSIENTRGYMIQYNINILTKKESFAFIKSLQDLGFEIL